MIRTGLHRSPSSTLNEITDGGIFGGIFAGPKAGMYGEYVYEVSSPRHLSDFALNYEVDGAWEAALELCDGDESLASVIMTPGCETEDPEEGWSAQRLRGQLARRLGYTSVEMLDETGECMLCLPGCSVTPAKG